MKGLIRICRIYFLWLSLSCLSVIQAAAQEDSCDLQISLLTCTPGQELYATFGHTAIRVKAAGQDWVFNYGTFDFNEPGFYTKFVRGKLNYFLSVETFPDFKNTYEYEGRGITEQLLNLTCREKAQLFYALQDNARENNRYYQYDFLFDNCTTRAGVIIRKNTSDSVILTHILAEPAPTFRDMLHQYLDRGQQYWSKLGIDILLGSRIDRKVSNLEAQFLPDYLMLGMDSTHLRNRPIVTQSQVILPAAIPTSDPPLQPLWVFLALFIGCVAATSYQKVWTQKLLRITDLLLFTLTGLIGLLLVFMWTGTDHQSCRDNLNLLWALPTHGVFIWFNNHSAIARKYFQAVSVLSLLVLLCWPLLPQQLNLGLIPVVATILFRSYHYAKKR